MIRPVEYEYLVRPFWSEGRFMLTRVLHEMVVNKAITVANANKIVHKKDPRPRIRPFVALGPTKIETPELYENFFLDILGQHGAMWVTDLVLRSHAKLDRDSDNFKKDYVEPVLSRKRYIRPFFGRTTQAKVMVKKIQKAVSDLEIHAKGNIDPKFVVEKLNVLGVNFILLDSATRKIIGKELPAFPVEFKSELGFGSHMSPSASINLAMFSSSIGDTSFDSGFGDSSFDGFDGGDFGGGGVDGNW